MPKLIAPTLETGYATTAASTAKMHPAGLPLTVETVGSVILTALIHVSTTTTVGEWHAPRHSPFTQMSARSYIASEPAHVGYGGLSPSALHIPSARSCDDGGPGSSFAACALGSDCTDCGARELPPPPPASPPPPPSNPPAPPFAPLPSGVELRPDVPTLVVTFNFEPILVTVHELDVIAHAIANISGCLDGAIPRCQVRDDRFFLPLAATAQTVRARGPVAGVTNLSFAVEFVDFGPNRNPDIRNDVERVRALLSSPDQTRLLAAFNEVVAPAVTVLRLTADPVVVQRTAIVAYIHPPSPPPTIPPLPPSPPPPSPPSPPAPPPGLCSNECNQGGLGTAGSCDDGVPGSEGTIGDLRYQAKTCPMGTDCDDCGVRIFCTDCPIECQTENLLQPDLACMQTMLDNKECDPACNKRECGYDNGRCTAAQITEACLARQDAGTIDYGSRPITSGLAVAISPVDRDDGRSFKVVSKQEADTNIAYRQVSAKRVTWMRA